MVKKSDELEQKKFVNRVNRIIGKLKHYYQIQDALLQNGFKKKAEGGFKAVFKHSDYGYCVKVWLNPYGYMSDSYHVPEEIKHHFVHPIFKNKRYMIQKWIKRKASEGGYRSRIKTLPKKHRFEWENKYDVWTDNIRVDGDREVIIDFCYQSSECSL